MAKRNRNTTKQKIENRLEQGRGRGEGANYVPWLKIQDVPSDGRVSRVKGWKTGRVHHLMSKLELMYFYLAEWSPIVVDIREQFPLLPIERTMEIAQELGLNHPKDPVSKEPIVMTTDFLLTVSIGASKHIWARTIKPTERLGKTELDKFRIEHRFYQEQGIDWGIVTNEDIPLILARNIEFIYDYYHLLDIPHLDEQLVSFIAPKLLMGIGKNSLPLSKECLQQDQLLGLHPGTCLSIVKHMLATRKWDTDMESEELQFSRKHNFAISELENGLEGWLS
ncbi:TnsA endonuclease N-terminal domain-containing protein [Brevibacillus porteri]|uniref:TnsA endonuclease N-terminal domain-containing protein n=1 Tax=Brevibacillus porteri TaxID=2126350 RepID=UPI003645A919